MKKYYISHAKKSYSNIAQQMEKVKQLFIDKYEKIIAKRIKESEEKEKNLNCQLRQLRENLERLNIIEQYFT